MADKFFVNPTTAPFIKTMNPHFKAPHRPFMRMSYVSAIAWLNEHKIQRPAEEAGGNVITKKDEETGNDELVMIYHEIGNNIMQKMPRKEEEQGPV
jgi:asparaginyl-tRNA synthetase